MLKGANLKLLFLIAVILMLGSVSSQSQDVNDLRLKDYRPKSIYNIPVTNVAKAKYPAIDMHTHVYGRTNDEIARWI